MSTARIASVHFLRVDANRNYTGIQWSIPACPLGGEPVVIEVTDVLQRDEGPVSSGPGGGRRQKLQYPVTADEIARDLVRQWTTDDLGISQDCHPGIWIVRDRIPLMTIDAETGLEVARLDVFSQQVFRPATEEERATMWAEDVAHNRAADVAFANYCHEQGNKIAADPRTRHLIPRRYKAAARHYGMQDDWSTPGAEQNMTPCPNCGKVVSKVHFICAYCNQPTDINRWAAFVAEKDAALEKAQKRQTVTTTAPAPPPPPAPLLPRKAA
jgi:endogenous inhibitor of DNA gyrase (YacG/DUF329 family)